MLETAKVRLSLICCCEAPAFSTSIFLLIKILISKFCDPTCLYIWLNQSQQWCFCYHYFGCILPAMHGTAIVVLGKYFATGVSVRNDYFATSYSYLPFTIDTIYIYLFDSRIILDIFLLFTHKYFLHQLYHLSVSSMKYGIFDR